MDDQVLLSVNHNYSKIWETKLLIHVLAGELSWIAYETHEGGGGGELF